VTRSARLLFFILILAALAACGENERVRRVTRVEYLALPKDAPVEIVSVDAPPEIVPKRGAQMYDRIAVVDSPHYAIPDYYPKSRKAVEMARHKAAAEQHEKLFEKMREDLRVMARELGGDCVQNVRKMKVQVRGVLPDQSAPLPGLKTQGAYDEYFLRGEVIKLAPRKPENPSRETTELVPPTASDTPTSATAPQPVPALPPPPTLKDENAADRNAAPETPVEAPEPAQPPQENSQPEQEMAPPKQ
jgi:hypothetical protein